MQELKNKIISNAHVLFLNRGIKWLYLDYIADASGISRRTLNQCFKKNELIDAVIKSKIEFYHQLLLQIENEQLEPVEELTKILSFSETLGYDFSDIFLRDLKRYYPDDWLLVDNFFNGALKKLFIRNLSAGIEKNIYRKTIDTNLLTEIYFISGLALIERISVRMQPELINKSIREMNENFLSGLIEHNN